MGWRTALFPQAMKGDRGGWSGRDRDKRERGMKKVYGSIFYSHLSRHLPPVQWDGQWRIFCSMMSQAVRPWPCRLIDGNVLQRLEETGIVRQECDRRAVDSVSRGETLA